MTDDSADGTRAEGLTFWEHLAELRSRLIYIAVSLLVGLFVGWGFREELFALLTAPVREGLAVHGIHRLTAIEAAEAMVVYLKLSLAAAIVLVVPVGLYQLWAFVRPGLLEREIRPMRRVVVLAFFMFVLGVLFCYRLVLPLVMEFLAAFTLGSGGVEFQVTMDSAYSTALLLLVGFGLVFELPLVMVLLATTPLVDWRKYLKWIRYAVVMAFVVGAVLTPPDVLSQFLMAVPLCVLYGVGIFLSYLMERQRLKGGDAPRGLDWGLLGMLVVLLGLAALLLLPRSLPAVSFLPYGAESVEWSAAGAIPRCGGLERGLPAEGREWACARYAEGSLLVGSGDERWDDGACSNQDGGQTGTCAVDDELLVAGQHLLVARYLHNRRMRLVDSDPVLPPDEATESLWVSLRRTEGRQPPFARIARVGEDPERLRVDLSFADAERAREFAAALEEGKELPAAAVAGGADRHSRIQQALLELTAVVEEIARSTRSGTTDPAVASPSPSAGHGESQAASGSNASRPAGLEARLAQVKALLADAEQQELGPHRLAECGGAACAYAVLSDLLPAPEEVQAQGRLVTAWYPADTELSRFVGLLGL